MPSPPGDSEKKFASDFRSALTAQGIGYIQLIEAGTPGAPDYVVQESRGPWVPRTAYVELKVNEHPLEPEQRKLLKKLHKAGHRAFVVRRVPHGIEIWRGAEQELQIFMLTAVARVNWQAELFTYA